MSKKLAIKGHSTRGNEVIELLKMLGGTNPFSNGMIIGNKTTNCYYISEDTATKYISWDYIGPDEINEYKIFTLEEFLDKYPYKIGDKVIDDSGESGIIIEMKWDEEIIYKVDFGKECYYFASDFLRPYKEANMNEIKPLFKAGDVVKLKGCPDKNIFWIVMDVVKDGYIFNGGEKCSFDDQHHYEKTNREVMLTAPPEIATLNMSAIDYNNGLVGYEIPEGYEFDTVIDNKIVLKKLKPIYPKTYDECKAVMQLQDSIIQAKCGYEYKLISYLQQLLMCRDAYWKIAGEQMGLGKPWKPDWNDDDEDIFCIYNVNGTIYSDGGYPATNKILVFPTEEMRDAFYVNFDYLIEACKELL